MVPEGTANRFRADLDALIPPGTRFGVAVSGGADSLALLLLAADVRPGEIEAATVDHGLRAESRAEAEAVGDLCEQLGVPHAILAIEWDVPPSTALQEQAREVRYGALAGWLGEQSLASVATAHHADDQAETLLMRLNRGSGIRGLSGMRPLAAVPGHPNLQLLRPLLGWRRTELEGVCEQADLIPIQDPSNSNERFERVRVRRALADADWLNQAALARSAANLADADDAVEWAAAMEWTRFAEVEEGAMTYRPAAAPAEILRRIVARAIEELGTEGSPGDLRGRELDRLLSDLQAGNTTTLRGVRCAGGQRWRFTPAPPRTS
ncbi:tRNA lysidine(34) synthetase TilS [Sphingomonas sp. SM33]|uniref:tRNA(Ile)-lysidine synthase n=1 Tax=Sphingomonas telluris TaxID=2907998 RepID=A0ABS9VN25_9SPHN|nr:tRNA lysidine(34) synthetase TilS [Sphingomonas telluris]MCH8616371.1 tRNA lysidine(34) synthetase TilS [Sphingomonas telluris]